MDGMGGRVCLLRFGECFQFPIRYVSWRINYYDVLKCILISLLSPKKTKTHVSCPGCSGYTRGYTRDTLLLHMWYVRPTSGSGTGLVAWRNFEFLGSRTVVSAQSAIFKSAFRHRKTPV